MKFERAVAHATALFFAAMALMSLLNHSVV